MYELKIIGWAAWLILSVFIVFEFVGMRRLVEMFPEGWRPWMPFAQFGSMTFFAIAVLCNPWS